MVACVHECTLAKNTGAGLAAGQRSVAGLGVAAFAGVGPGGLGDSGQHQPGLAGLAVCADAPHQPPRCHPGSRPVGAAARLVAGGADLYLGVWLAAALCPPSAARLVATTPTGQRGVVLVHGFLCNRGVWLPWLPELRARGHAYVALTLEPAFGSVDDYVAAIDTAMRQVQAATGLPPVLVGHSMGGLAARAWLRTLAQPPAQRVHRILTLGTPHHGTWPARFSHTTNGMQMRLDSPWLQALAASEGAAQRALFSCWYSDCDNIVYPTRSATLDGADNHLLHGLGHVHMVYAPQVRAACWQALQTGPGSAVSN